MITKPSWDGAADRSRPRIGYAALCQAVPDCGRSAAARNLREGLRKVADVVDIWGQPAGRRAACDAVLAIDCASPVPEPYFIYLCPEQDNVAPADPAVYERAVGLFAKNGRLAHCLAEGTGIPREKIHVILPAVTACQDLRSMSPPRLRQAPRRRLLLRVGDGCGQHLSPKPVRRVLDALEILRLEYDARISLTISALENWPLAGFLPDGVSLTGVLPAGDAIALIDSHDLLVVPPGNEFAGLPEALSRGVPSVVARTNEMSEAITPEVTGALIDGKDARELADAVASVLDNDEVYRNCYQRAPAMAAYFSWERVARQIASVISREVGFSSLPYAPAVSQSWYRYKRIDHGSFHGSPSMKPGSTRHGSSRSFARL